MKLITSFLKHGCSTTVSRNGELPITFSLDGHGSIEQDGGRIAKFSAPTANAAGRSTIRSIDNLGVEEEITVRWGSHLHILANIIEKELGLASGQVVLEWEDFKPKKDGKTMYYIGTQSTSIVGNNYHLDEDEKQYLSCLDTISLQVMGPSRDVQREARLAIMALKGFYARSQCEINNIKIASIPQSLSNVSQAEGPGPLKRFAGVFNVFYNDFINKEVQIYENFSTVFIQEP